MNSSGWLLRSVQSFGRGLHLTGQAAATPPEALLAAVPGDPKGRSTRERLHAVMKHKEEALSPRLLRRVLTELQSVVDVQVSEVEGGRRARALALWYAGATAAQRLDIWLLMSEQFAPKSEKIQAARDHYEACQGTSEEGQAEIRLRQAFVSPRTRLLKRFSVFAEGMKVAE